VKRTILIVTVLLAAIIVPTVIAQQQGIHGTWWIDGQEYACTCEPVGPPPPPPPPPPGEYTSCYDNPLGSQTWGYNLEMMISTWK